jgi:hypothetical protein
MHLGEAEFISVSINGTKLHSSCAISSSLKMQLLCQFMYWRLKNQYGLVPPPHKKKVCILGNSGLYNNNAQWTAENIHG